MESYSPFFQTLHDERSPAGHLGNGAHASILRAIVFHDPYRNPLSDGIEFDFAVIWDADHDTRVIKAVEAIYRAGRLSAILMIGERKGTLHAIASESVKDDYVKHLEYFEHKLHDIAQNMEGDPWSASARALANPGRMIIDDDEEKVRLYLSNLKMLWRLGALKIKYEDHLSFKPRPRTRRTMTMSEYIQSLTHEIAENLPGRPDRLEPAEFEVWWKKAEELALKKVAAMDRAK